MFSTFITKIHVHSNNSVRVYDSQGVVGIRIGLQSWCFTKIYRVSANLYFTARLTPRGETNSWQGIRRYPVIFRKTLVKYSQYPVGRTNLRSKSLSTKDCRCVVMNVFSSSVSISTSFAPALSQYDWTQNILL